MELASGISVARGLKPAPWVLGARVKLSTGRPHHCLLPARGLTPAAGRASSSPPPATARFVYTSRAAPQAGPRPGPGGDIGQKLFGSVSGAGARAGSPAPGAPHRLHRGPARSPCGTVGVPVKLGGRRVPEPGLGSRAGPGVSGASGWGRGDCAARRGRVPNAEEGACGAAAGWARGPLGPRELGRPSPQAHSPDTFNWPPRNQPILPLRKSQSLTVW